jgi:Domain of unknown function (DUF4123)
MALYFAVDRPLTGSLADAILRAISFTPNDAHSGSALFALIDLAFDYGEAPLKLLWPSEDLYSEGRWATLAAASPRLVALPAEGTQELREAVSRLAYHCAGRPMLSIVSSVLPIDDLARWWRSLIAADVAGTDPMLLRFADTRVSFDLAGCLSAKNWTRLAAPLDRWWVIDRRGQARELPLPNGRKALLNQTDNEAFELSDAELGKLVQAGLPDALINTMAEQLPELVPTDGRADFYEAMQRVVACATDHAIESYPDTYALAVYSATSGDANLQSPALHQVLQAKDWKTGELSARLLELL